jgi:hypothetical protein
MSYKKLPLLFCSVSLTFACSGTSDAANGYRLYVNERYGYEILYPSFFIANGVSLSGDGQIFTSPQNDAELRVFAHTCSEEQQSISSYMKTYSKREAEGALVVTYRHKSRDSAVVSGHIGKKIFYRKLLRSDSDWCTEFSFEYEEAHKENYDKVTSTIAASFKQ